MTREAYYKGKLDRTQERAAYHEQRFEETGNPYHDEQASRLRDEEAKLTSKLKNDKTKKKTQKDIGPMSPGMAPPIA